MRLATAGDCRKFVGALMYVARATRPDATYAVNKLARGVSCWSKASDAELAHVVGHLSATEGHGLCMNVDVRDKKEDLWLELWVDADHAGGDDRKSTGGWALLPRGGHGTKVALDWASKK